MLSYTVTPGHGSHRDGAPWLLVSHGASFCKECWNPAIEELLEAAAGRIRAVVAFDFRGHGRSPPLELTEETFIDDDDATKTRSDSSSVRKRLKCAKWEKFAVEDTLAMVEVIKRLSGKADPPIIGLGHSLGGAAMILLSISRPEIFTRLILYEAPIAPANSPEMGRLKLKIAKAVESARISQFKDEMEAFRIIRTSRPWKDFEFRALKGFFSGGLTRVDESDGTYTLRLVCSAETEAAIFRGSPHDGYQRLRDVPVHVDFMYGAKTIDLGGAERFRKLVSQIPHGRGIELPDATHLAPFEKPKQVSDAICRILGWAPSKL